MKLQCNIVYYGKDPLNRKPPRDSIDHIICSQPPFDKRWSFREHIKRVPAKGCGVGTALQNTGWIGSPLWCGGASCPYEYCNEEHGSAVAENDAAVYNPEPLITKAWTIILSWGNEVVGNEHPTEGIHKDRNGRRRRNANALLVGFRFRGATGWGVHSFHASKNKHAEVTEVQDAGQICERPDQVERGLFVST